VIALAGRVHAGRFGELPRGWRCSGPARRPSSRRR